MEFAVQFQYQLKGWTNNMVLAVDVGNTHTVLGCIEEGNIRCIERIVTNPMSTGSEYAVQLRQILEFEEIDYKNLEGAILSSVVPQVDEAIKTAIRKLTGKEPLVVGAGIRTGLNIKIDDPSQAGADLVAACVGALEEYGTPLIVLDLGTATTAMVLDQNGAFRGGAIMSGVKLSLNALTEHTSLLQQVSVEAPKNCIGTNTVDCLKAGAVFGHAAMIDGIIDRMEQELGYTSKVVATGGLSRAIVKECRHEIIVDDNLLLKGLWILFRKNVK